MFDYCSILIRVKTKNHLSILSVNLSNFKSYYRFLNICKSSNYQNTVQTYSPAYTTHTRHVPILHIVIIIIAVPIV